MYLYIHSYMDVIGASVPKGTWLVTPTINDALSKRRAKSTMLSGMRFVLLKKK